MKISSLFIKFKPNCIQSFTLTDLEKNSKSGCGVEFKMTLPSFVNNLVELSDLHT